MLLISKFIMSRIDFFTNKSKSKSFVVVPLSNIKFKSHPTYPYV